MTTKRIGLILLIGALVLSGLVVVLVRTLGPDGGPTAVPTMPSVSSTPPDGTYCYGCFYTTTLPAFQVQAEAKGYTCPTDGECTKGAAAVLTFHSLPQHPTRLGRLTVRTFTPGPPDRKQGSALAITAMNAELKALLAEVFVDPKIQAAVLEWFDTSLTYRDCHPMTITGFHLTCTAPTTTAVADRTVTWSAAAAIEGEYNR